jgi:hypothetical protein
MTQAEDVIFALQPGTIQIDDIVLTSDFGIVRLGIRTFTRSDFSHAALCTKADMLFEAVPDGVMRRSVLGTYAPRPEWLRVLRPKEPLPPNGHGLRVADYAEALYGRAYSVRGAVASRLAIVGGSDDGSVFCSQVIAQAFHDYGRPLLPGKLPAQIYPGLLLDSPELTDVTGNCIRKLGSLTDAELYQEVIDTANHDLPGAEMRMNRRAFGAVQKCFAGDLPANVLSLTDLAIWMSHDFNTDVVQRSDPRILAILESEQFFGWYDGFSLKVRQEAAVMELAAMQAEASVGLPLTAEIQALIDDFGEVVSVGEVSLAARKNTASEYENLAARTGLETFARLRDMYRRQFEDANRLQQAKLRLIAALRQRKP